MIRTFIIAHIIAFALSVSVAQALTLDEALSRARETIPAYKASLLKIKSADA